VHFFGVFLLYNYITMHGAKKKHGSGDSMGSSLNSGTPLY